MVEKKALHFTCGEFSEKWFKASSVIPWTETEKVSVPYGEGITPRSDENADFIAVTLNETSTGVMCLDLPEVGEKTLLAVDATSGGGQSPCDISKTDIFFVQTVL